MDARLAFKVGFIRRMIDLGYTTPSEIRDVVKSAIEKRAAGGNPITDLVGSMGRLALPVALAGPAVVGGIAGNLAAKATDISDYDVDEAKQQEVVDEYRRQSAKLQRQGLLRRLGGGGVL